MAHVKRNPDGTWAEPHLLERHLEETARLAAGFAAKFQSKSWGYAIGFIHDYGKSTSEWQRYLCMKSDYDEEDPTEGRIGRVEHSTSSAKIAEEIFGKGIGRLLAYGIAGHHAGLPDMMAEGPEGKKSLAFRLQQPMKNAIPEGFLLRAHQVKKPAPPWMFSRNSLDLSLWLRMLFSCLVDADFLDTESYMNPEKSQLRSAYRKPSDLLRRFDEFMSEKIAGAEKTSVNDVRLSVLQDCRQKASSPPGLFSLTVPTGGGKTLSSLAFALEHAVAKEMDRIIYVIPYTSIIEQNADVFREALGADQVVEHHSNLDEENLSQKAKLASENWDAPLIVTTSVQFFESLFASRTGRCRKLHNIANSVVILDEAQLVPTEYLAPILQTMDLLVQHYKVTFVISTATQPALAAREDFSGLTHPIREIVTDVPRIYERLQRVTIETPEDWQARTEWIDLARELQRHRQVLCIVSDRKSCRELHRLMPQGAIHLSALMCGQHRSDVIADIKRKLKNEEPICVISTQLVEAGVDLDFPVVYRAMAGLDSIAQAAGRCNREGKRIEGGKVIVFRPPRKAPVGILRKASETAEILLRGGTEDVLGSAMFEKFFSELYWKANSLDEKEILPLLIPGSDGECGMQFRTAANRFRMIDDQAQRSILVPYGEDGKKYIAMLKIKGPERWILRKLQRYTVNVYLGDFYALEKKGAIDYISGDRDSGIYAVNNDCDYDRQLGLLVNDGPADLDLFIQ